MKRGIASNEYLGNVGEKFGDCSTLDDVVLSFSDMVSF